MNRFRLDKENVVTDSAGQEWVVSTVSFGNRKFESLVYPIIYGPEKSFILYDFGTEEQLVTTKKPKHAKWMHRHLCEMYSQ
jgi:hypothetical protein